MILFKSGDVHKRERLIKEHIIRLRRIKKLGFVDIAPYRAPGIVIDYFEDYINDKAIAKWNNAIE